MECCACFRNGQQKSGKFRLLHCYRTSNRLVTELWQNSTHDNRYCVLDTSVKNYTIILIPPQNFSKFVFLEHWAYVVTFTSVKVTTCKISTFTHIQTVPVSWQRHILVYCSVFICLISTLNINWHVSRRININIPVSVNAHFNPLCESRFLKNMETIVIHARCCKQN